MYYADWVRALAIQLVIFIHCLVNSADAVQFDPEEEYEFQQKKDGIIKSLVQIGIPMFFYISGMGATFFNTEKKGFGLFFVNKTLRLMVPFVVAIFIFLMPRLYFGQQYEDWTRPDREHIETDYWQFNIKSLPGILGKLSWLWYLPALMIDCLLTYPLLAWSMRRAYKIPYNARDDGNIIFLQLALLATWAIPAVYLDTDDRYGERFLLPSILTLSLILMLFYVLQLPITSEGGDSFAMWIKLLGPLGSIALNLWKDQSKNKPLHHVFMMINYDAVFFSQGLIDALYFKQMMRTRKKLADSVAAPLFVLLFIFTYSLTSPMNYQQTGFLFFYPLYTDYTIQCLYTTGTWMWVFTIVWMMHWFANKTFNKTAYKLITGSALYAYLSHYFFIIMIALFIIRPYKLTFMQALMLEIVGTNVAILVTYLILNFFYELIFPEPKKQQELEGTEEEKQALLEQQAAVAKVK